MPACCSLVHPVHPLDTPPATTVLDGAAVALDPHTGPATSRADAVAAALLVWFTGLVLTTAAVAVVAVNVPLLELVARIGNG